MEPGAGMVMTQERGSDPQPEAGPAARLDNLLADYGAERLRRIACDGFARLQQLLSALAGAAVLGDPEDCARLLHRLRMQAADDGFHGFAAACRLHERRARGGTAPAPAEVTALHGACRTAWSRMDALLAARAVPGQSAGPI